MATVASEDTRQDAGDIVLELCSNFPTAVQGSSFEETPELHPKTANSKRGRRVAGVNEASSSTPRSRDTNITSTSTMSETSVFYTTLQDFPPPDQAPALRPMDASFTSSSATQYYSARIQSMIENRANCSDIVEYEIESSKVHRSTIERPGRSSERRIVTQESGDSGISSEDENEDEEDDERELDEEILRANRETIEQERQHHAWARCFEDRDRLYEKRDKIGEGGEAKIYAGIRTDLSEGEEGRHVVFKVFPKGYYLRDLVTLWPEGAFNSVFIRGTMIEHVMLLPNDGRIAMVMKRAWGDLRKFIDLRKEVNGNQGPPFNCKDVVEQMFAIAREMLSLHEDNVVHRDLKASNVLLYGSNDKFSPLGTNVGDIELQFVDGAQVVSDYECALGVMGTGFWRAPEVLLGIRDPKKRRSPTLFTKKSDVYSYGMLCYEIATGFLPFEWEEFSGTKAEQDLVINGQRPLFPNDVDCGVKDLITRCWHQDEDKRPTFYEIHDETYNLLEKVLNTMSSC